jgi:pSer/pThr/pTyr-binding forkhead associated (FHA) protein
MPIRLVPLDEADTLPTIVIDRPLVLVGRHSECDVQIRSSKVSRKHCCLAEMIDEGAGMPCLSVRDLDSTNGTRINGAVVAEGRLKEGDELTVGAYRFLVMANDTGADPAQLSCEYPIPILEAPHDHILESRPTSMAPDQPK